MNWNIEELKELLSKVKNMSRTIETIFDMNVLNYMIYYLDSSWKFEGVEIGNSRYDECVLEFVSSNYDSIKKALLNFCDDKVKTKGLFFNTGMKSEKVDKITSEFFKYYDENLFNQYLDLKDGSRICLMSKKYPDSQAKGKTFHLCTTGNCYVGVRFDKRIFSSSILVHELGHVHQLEGISDLYLRNRRTTSIWSEAFPIFLENFYATYLKNNGKKEMGERLEYENIDHFLALVDCMYTRYFSGDLEQFKHEFKDRYPVIRLCSYFLAFHFANELLENPSYSKNLVDNFNFVIGRIDDNKILKAYGKEEVFDSPREVINRYRRGI